MLNGTQRYSNQSGSLFGGGSSDDDDEVGGGSERLLTVEKQAKLGQAKVAWNRSKNETQVRTRQQQRQQQWRRAAEVDWTDRRTVGGGEGQIRV